MMTFLPEDGEMRGVWGAQIATIIIHGVAEMFDATDATGMPQRNYAAKTTPSDHRDHRDHGHNVTRVELPFPKPRLSAQETTRTMPHMPHMVTKP